MPFGAPGGQYMSARAVSNPLERVSAAEQFLKARSPAGGQVGRWRRPGDAHRRRRQIVQRAALVRGIDEHAARVTRGAISRTPFEVLFVQRHVEAVAADEHDVALDERRRDAIDRHDQVGTEAARECAAFGVFARLLLAEKSEPVRLPTTV